MQLIHTFASINEFFDEMDLKQFEKISKALGDINRLKILDDMSQKGGCVQCSEVIKVLELAQPSVSHHIKTLLEAGLIASTKNGRHHTYLLNKPLLDEFRTRLGTFAG